MVNLPTLFLQSSGIEFHSLITRLHDHLSLALEKVHPSNNPSHPFSKTEIAKTILYSKHLFIYSGNGFRFGNRFDCLREGKKNLAKKKGGGKPCDACCCVADHHAKHYAKCQTEATWHTAWRSGYTWQIVWCAA